MYNVVLDFFKGFSGITGRAVDEEVIDSNLTLNINQELSSEDKIIVEYETPAPYSEEILNGSKKEITIIGPEEVHYTDILAFSELPKEVKNAEEIKLYWINESSGEKQEASFSAYDFNNNSFGIDECCNVFIRKEDDKNIEEEYKDNVMKKVIKDDYILYIVM